MIADLVAGLLMLTGAILMLIASLGLLRMPDLYSRLQAGTKAATLGLGCFTLATAVSFGDLAVVSRAALISLFVLLTAPVGASLLSRAAYRVGTPLSAQTLRDEWELNGSADAVEATETQT